jgi:hypothetical protein
MSYGRVGLAAALLATAGACAPYGFSKEVSDMSASAKTFGGSVASGHQALVDAKAAAYRRMLIANRSAVVRSDNCFPPKRPDPYVPTGKPPEKASEKDKPEFKPDPAMLQQPCGVYLPKDSTEIENPLPTPAIMKRSVAALSDYMGGLAAITNATDRSNYDDAVKKVSASVSALAGAANLAAAPVVGAGLNIFGWLLGNALDIQRFQVLKQVVNTVQPTDPTKPQPFNTVVYAIAIQIDQVVDRRRADLNNEINIRRQTLGNGLPEGTYRARLADLDAMAATVQALNQTSGQEIANDLVKAHEHLVWAVNSYQPDIGDLLEAVGTLKDKVSALQDALAKASAAAKKES